MSKRLTFNLVCLSVILHVSNAFYLSLHALEWLNASNYCQSYCDSQLASIHSQQDHLTTLDLIDHNANVYTRVWLGLNDIQTSDAWEWSDASILDFGGIKDVTTGRIVRGTFPWRSDEPDYNDSDQCVALEVGSNYIGSNSREWVDRKLTANYHFFCNGCSGKVHKYAVVNGGTNYTNAEKACQDKFGTSLASIHSDNDMDEATSVCKQLTSSSGCWLGLNDQKDTRVYEWTDGTAWDYGTVLNEYPWYISEPGSASSQLCIFLDPSNGADPGEYLMDDYWCERTKPRPLCNAPSEICAPQQWNVIRGSPNGWTWTQKPCGVAKTVQEAESVALLGDKQYLNTAGVLTIDMMYSITSLGAYGNAGLALYFDTTDCDNYYYIGIWGEYSMMFIGKYVNNVWSLIQHALIAPAYVLNVPYSLRIELTAGTEWNILLNSQPLIAVSDNEFSNANNKLSGYVALRNVNAMFDVKSLYISGEVQHDDTTNNWWRQCTNAPTAAPTLSTLNPSVAPTGFPTLEPTLTPSAAPTADTNSPSTSPTPLPSTSPTIEPTFLPSTSPTMEPTFLPTLEPTVTSRSPSDSPTLFPSEVPTVSPSNNPTVEPTVHVATNNPSLNPTNEPTAEPTHQPTNSPTNEPSHSPVTANPTISTVVDVNITDHVIQVYEESIVVTERRSQMIWIVGIPIGLVMFCFFGVYLLYNYCKQTRENFKNKNVCVDDASIRKQSRSNSIRLETEEPEEADIALQVTQSDAFEQEEENEEHNLLQVTTPNGVGIDDESGALHDPIHTDDNFDSDQGENGDYAQDGNDTAVELEIEMAVTMAAVDNDGGVVDTEDIDVDDMDIDDVAVAFDMDDDEYDDGQNMITTPLNYRMKSKYAT